MKNCPYCNAALDDSAAFCTSCGNALAAPQQPAAPYAQPAAPYAQQPAAPYAQPAYAAPVNDQSKSVLVFGILGLAFACSFYFSVLGLIFSIISGSKYNAYIAAGGQPAGKAKVGRILGKVGLILSIVMLALLLIVIIAAIASN